MTRTRLTVAWLLVFCAIAVGYVSMRDNRSPAERASQRIAKALSNVGEVLLVDKADIYLVEAMVNKKGGTVLAISHLVTDKNLEEYQNEQEVAWWVIEKNCPKDKECPKVTEVQIAIDEGPDGKADGFLMRKNMNNPSVESMLVIYHGKKVEKELEEEPADASPEEMKMAEDSYEKFLQVVMRELENGK